jgi:hypothetical protein
VQKQAGDCRLPQGFVIMMHVPAKVHCHPVLLQAAIRDIQGHLQITNLC